MSKLTLRLAEIEDVEAIVPLINVAFLAERPFVKNERIQAAGVRDLLTKGQFILGYLDEELVGCVFVETHRPRAYLGLLSVDPAHQHDGLGTELMAAGEKRCREAGTEGIDLQFINHRTELLRFYSKLGYRENGTAPFPDTARMKMPFHFIRMSKELG
jgi:ribosomal protein S18 acetylase RimI-like enzyme